VSQLLERSEIVYSIPLNLTVNTERVEIEKKTMSSTQKMLAGLCWPTESVRI